VQSGVAVTVVAQLGLSRELTILVMGVMTLAKGYLASRLSATQTAATLPASVEVAAARSVLFNAGLEEESAA